MAATSLSLMLPLAAIKRFASSSEGHTGNTMIHPQQWYCWLYVMILLPLCNQLGIYTHQITSVRIKLLLCTIWNTSLPRCFILPYSSQYSLPLSCHCSVWHSCSLSHSQPNLWHGQNACKVIGWVCPWSEGHYTLFVIALMFSASGQLKCSYHLCFWLQMAAFVKQFQNGRWTKSRNPLILIVMHHRQNPSDSTNIGMLLLLIVLFLHFCMSRDVMIHT
jgi:hypothetical protein